MATATVKQKVAFREVVKGSTLTAAMRKANYSPSTAKRTNKLTNTKGWQELMDTFISDEKLAKVHNEGLRATNPFNKIVGRDSKGAPTYEMVKVADYSTRHKYLESGYKIKGRHAKEAEGARILIVNITDKAATKYGINPSSGNGDK